MHYRLTTAMGALVFLASVGTANGQSCQYGEDTCKQGYVWRDAFAGDHVCVSGQTRQQAISDNAQFIVRSLFPSPICQQGWVWREARTGDFVCVTGQTREQARADNVEAASRRDPACAAPQGSYRDTCKNFFFSNAVLSAECKDFGGNYRARTSLANPSTCTDDIANIGGYLGCNKRTSPQGSYRNSCGPWIWALETSLHALCGTPDARRQKEQLDNDGICVGDIFFDDLYQQDSGLHCSRAPLPDGPYRSSCKFIWVESNVLFAKCSKHSSRPWPFGSTVWNSARLTNVSACRGEIRNVSGDLVCAETFPAPNLIDKNLPDAIRSISGAGLVLGRLDSSCAGVYESLTIVKAQSPAANSNVRTGDVINVTRCESNQPTAQCPDGSAPRQYSYCVRCPSNITFSTVFSVSGLTCKSESDTKSYLEINVYGNCSLTERLCP